MVKIVNKTWQIDRFNNGPCQGDSKNGTCYTTEECETKGGTNSGSCASGYGVCCTCNKLWFFNEKIPNFIIVKHFSYCQMWSSNKRKLHIFRIFRIGNWTMWDQNLQMWLEYLSSILFPSFSILHFENDFVISVEAGFLTICNHRTINFNRISLENVSRSGNVKKGCLGAKVVT